MTKALFISVEGGEGSGKSSLAKALVEALQECGKELVYCREPGGSSLSEKIRSILLQRQDSIDAKAELLLFLAARAQHLSEVIMPALKSGKTVLCDRYHDSSVAYQGAGRGLGEALVKSLCSSTGPWPDLTLYLDVSPQIGLERARKRKALDTIESESLAFHQKIRQAFLALAKQEPERIIVIDAEQPMEAVFTQALNKILQDDEKL